MDKRLLITGGDGLVGRSFDNLDLSKYDYVYKSSRKNDGDLTNEVNVRALYYTHKPTHVIHAAARVGGIGRNLSSPAQQFYDNILMNTYMVEYARLCNVKKLLAFSSTCAFPGDIDIQKEEDFHKGEPFEAHKSYAYAKRMVDIQIEAYNKQYGLDYSVIIPGNIFGKYDNFNLADGHVVPSLIHKCYIAKQTKTPFKVWGTGEARREFLFVEDVSNICLKMLDKSNIQRLIVSGNTYSIKEIVEIICRSFNYYEVEWEKGMPEGQKNRGSDKTLLYKLFPEFVLTSVEDSLKETCKWFESNYENTRK